MPYLLGYVIEPCLSVAPVPLTQVTQLAWYTTMSFAGCLPLVALTRHQQRHQQQLLSGCKKLVSSLISVCSQCQRHQRGHRRCWRRLEGEEERLAKHSVFWQGGAGQATRVT